MNRIKKAFPFIITGMMVLLLFVIQFTVITPKTISETFWVNLGVNAAIIVATSITWMASGTDRAKNENGSAYRDNAEKYAGKIAEIEKSGKLGALSAFCKQKTEELLDERRRGILARVCVDRGTYDELKRKTEAELKTMGYRKKQIKAIERIRSGGRFPERLRKNSLKVRPINALELTTNNKARNAYDVQYDEAADKMISILLRVVKSMITGAALAYISFELAANFWDIAAWAMFLMKLATIAYCAWGAEREGYEQLAVTKNKVILNRMAFLYLFNEWARVPLLEEGKK